MIQFRQKQKVQDRLITQIRLRSKKFISEMYCNSYRGENARGNPVKQTSLHEDTIKTPP